VLRVEQAEQVEHQHVVRSVSWRHGEDGSLVLQARLPAEQGALVVTALEAVRECLEAERGEVEPQVSTDVSADVSAVTSDECPPREPLAARVLDDGAIRFTRLHGVAIAPAGDVSAETPGSLAGLLEANREAGLAIGPQTGQCLWDGVPMDLAMALDGMLQCDGRL
jgi:hypothetical protein